MAAKPRRNPSRPAVAFLPWVAIDQPRRIGPVRLIPYQHAATPGDLPSVTQAALDAVLGAYADRPRKALAKATLLEVGKWRSGDDASRALASLFRARDFLRIAALSKRRLFQGHFGYCNTHNYELVVQAFDPQNLDSIALRTRRRDGGDGILWGANEFAFHRPLHVTNDLKAVVDEPLLRALMRIPRSEGWLHEAVIQFNAANTDSSDVPVHAEVVMTKSAFEWLLRIDHEAKNFIKAVLQELQPAAPPPVPSGPLTPQWLVKSPPGGVLEAWAREFCIVRNMAAHAGKQGPKLVWSSESHLAFASLLFPLLLKKVLADLGRYKLTGPDRLHLSVIREYLCHEPFDGKRRALGKHPWTKILDDALLSAAIESALKRAAKRHGFP